MRIDVILPAHLPAAEMLELGRLAEGQGLGAVWVANVLASRDPFVNFVPLAMQTGTSGERPFDTIAMGYFPADRPTVAFGLVLFGGGKAEIHAARVVAELQRAVGELAPEYVAS